MPICIAGMHRAGTSMVTRMLNLCGMFLGDEEDLILPGDENPEGYWENRRFIHLNEEILDTLGGAWDMPPTPAEGWEGSSELSDLRQQARELKRLYEEHELWGWKDPRNCLTLPFWNSVVSDLAVVIVVRSPLNVAGSLAKRGSSSRRFAFALWTTYYGQLINDAVRMRTLVTHYDSYFHDAAEELRRVAREVGLPFTENELGEAAASVRRALRHHAHRDEALHTSKLPRDVLVLYERLCSLAGPVYDTASSRAQGEVGEESVQSIERRLDRSSEIQRLRLDRDRYRHEVETLSGLRDRDRARISELTATQERYRAELEKLRELRNRDKARFAELSANQERYRAELLSLRGRVKLEDPAGAAPPKRARQ